MTVEETPPTLDEVAASFRDARGDGADEDWARSAAVRFVLDDVRGPLARQALAGLVPVVRESGEPARELFGDAAAWATERQAAWRAEGVPASGPDVPTTVPELVHDLFFGAAVTAVVLMVVRLLTEGWDLDLNLALVLLPLLMSLGILGVRIVWHAAMRRFPRAGAVGVAAVVLVVYSVLVAGVFAVTSPVSFGQRSGLWMLAAAAVYGLVASVVGRRWPAPDPTPPPDAVGSDEAWQRALRAALRGRGDVPEARVRAVVDEAVRHAADAGRSLQQEFGSPASYAARFAPDAAVAGRRSAWWWTATALAPVALFATYVVADGWHWQGAFVGLGLWFALCVAMAAAAWRRSVAGARSSGP
ncbi:hypothetical protein ABE437_01310 [Isoptericola cucumis]|uniref:hypothetical protein n=1 Tax=Isoptericola cucumis TaxID=1776856 RepID=UPI003209B895